MLSSVNEWPQPRKKHSCVFGHVGHVDQPCFGTVLGKENGAIYLLVCFPSPASWWSKCIPQAFSSSQFQMPVQHLREDQVSSNLMGSNLGTGAAIIFAAMEKIK